MRTNWYLAIAANGVVISCAHAVRADQCFLKSPAPLAADPDSPPSIRDGCRDDFHLSIRTRTETVNTAHGDTWEVELETISKEKWEQRESDWSTGVFWSDSPSYLDSYGLYCIYAEAMSLHERASHLAAPGRFVLGGAFAYIRKELVEVVPVCDLEETRSAFSGAPGYLEEIFGSTKLFQGWFDDYAAARAASLIHEAWHIGKVRWHNGSKLLDPETGKKTFTRDRRYRSAYHDGGHSLATTSVGVYSIEVDWIDDYIDLPNPELTETGRIAIDSSNRDKVLMRGNRILRDRFEEQTLHRLNSFDPAHLENAADTLDLVDPTVEHSVYAFDGAPSAERRKFLPAVAGSEVCALVGLQGAFRERGDSVRLDTQSYVLPDGTSVDFWTFEAENVSGDRIEAGTQGLARCFPAKRPVSVYSESSNSGRYTIHGEDQYLRETLELDGHFFGAADGSCFLTGVEGRFEGTRDAMGVRLNGDDYWEVFIETNTNPSNNFFALEVMCIDAQMSDFIASGIGFVSSSSHGVHYDGAEPWKYSHACALSQVSGRLWAVSDLVEVNEFGFIGQPVRDLPCGDPVAGYGNTCTNWSIIVTGDNHVGNRDPAHGAVCFENW